MIRNRYIAAVNDKPWWLAGGIPQSACVAAYQPKGAASYAASLVNLANPGTYNAAAGNAPDWDASNGWMFVKANSNYLKTNINPVDGWSVTVRYSNYVSNTGDTAFILARGYTAEYRWQEFGIKGYNAAIRPTVGNTHLNSYPGNDSILILAGKNYYDNGTYIGTIDSTYYHTNFQLEIGINRKVPSYTSVYIQAISIYNTDISSYAGTLATAMNAI